MQNMGWIKDPLETTDSFTIKSGLSDGLYFIDGITEGVTASPDLLPDLMSFTSPEFERSSDVVDDKIDLLVYITFDTNAVSSDGVVILTFPDDVIYDMNETPDAYLVTNSSATASVTSKSTYSSGAIESLTITDVCGSSG